MEARNGERDGWVKGGGIQEKGRWAMRAGKGRGRRGSSAPR